MNVIKIMEVVYCTKKKKYEKNKKKSWQQFMFANCDTILFVAGFLALKAFGLS